MVIVMSCVDVDGVKGKLLSVIFMRDGFMLHVGILIASITNLFPSLLSLYQIWYIIVSTTVSIMNQMYSWQILRSSVTESAQISDGFTTRDIEKSLSDLIVQIASVLRALVQRSKTCQIKLVFRWRLIQFKVNQLSADITMQPSSTSASAASSATHSIIDELADRDKCKKNMYKL